MGKCYELKCKDRGGSPFSHFLFSLHPHFLKVGYNLHSAMICHRYGPYQDFVAKSLSNAFKASVPVVPKMDESVM